MRNVITKLSLFSALSVVMLLAGCSGRYEPYEEPAFLVTPEGVQLPDCESYDLAAMEPAVRGCFIERSRWQMMVHPQKMVPSAGTAQKE